MLAAELCTCAGPRVFDEVLRRVGIAEAEEGGGEDGGPAPVAGEHAYRGSTIKAGRCWRHWLSASLCALALYIFFWCSSGCGGSCSRTSRSVVSAAPSCCLPAAAGAADLPAGRVDDAVLVERLSLPRRHSAGQSAW